MSLPQWNELEIVGFNGSPLVECGRALPVARRKSDGMHCVLDFERGSTSLAWYAEEEAASYAAAKRWAMFERPLSPPKSCQPGTGGELDVQPMVVFADDHVLDMADRVPRPDMWQGEYLMWRRLKDHSDSTQAACASARTVETLLDDWASGLLDRFDAMFRIGRDRNYLKRIADFALCAARSRSLRWKSYLRHACSQEPDHVLRTFNTFTKREFPGLEWHEFLREYGNLADVLRVQLPQPSVLSAPVATTSSVSAVSKVSNIAAAVPVAV